MGEVPLYPMPPSKMFFVATSCKREVRSIPLPSGPGRSTRDVIFLTISPSAMISQEAIGTVIEGEKDTGKDNDDLVAQSRGKI